MQSSELKPFLQLGQVSEKGKFIPFGMKEIELEVCSYAFIRGVDGRDKVSTDLMGGNISFVSSKIPSVGILEWGVKTDKYYSGYIHFRKEGTTVHRLFFQHAACVNLKISYENAGSPYLTVQGTLQANYFTIGESPRFTNHWAIERVDSSYNVSTEAKDETADFFGVVLNPEASLSAFMTLNGITYELNSFEMEFAQEVFPAKGEPQTSVRGGFASVSLFQLPDDNISNWLRSPNDQRAHGEFRFGDPAYGFPLKITFVEAACAGLFAQCANYSSQNVLTRLNIAPMALVMNGVTYRNYSVREPEKQPTWGNKK
jgi:hypothetical protein